MSLVRHVRLRCPAGNAKPGPAIGQSLGPLGINMADFCKQFNERTEPVYVKDTELSVQLAAFSDRSFEFNVRTPPTSWMIKRVVGMKKGPDAPNLERPTAYITPEAVYEIAKIKQQDDMRWHLPLEGIARSVIGTCRTLGVAVRESDEFEEDGDNSEGTEADATESGSEESGEEDKSSEKEQKPSKKDKKKAKKTKED